MTTQATAATVRSSIVVDAPVERAFTTYTRDMGTWWPKEHHIAQDVVETVFEPKVGGFIYDRSADGTVCKFSRILTYEPPTRVVYTWDISLQWQIETDPTRTSEVEVRFIAEGPSRTRVDVEHRHLDRHGDGWENMRDAVAAANGWELTLRCLADRLAS